jgi:hypothetical protein
MPLFFRIYLSAWPLPHTLLSRSISKEECLFQIREGELAHTFTAPKHKLLTLNLKNYQELWQGFLQNNETIPRKFVTFW